MWINSVKNTAASKKHAFNQNPAIIFVGLWLLLTLSFPASSANCASTRIDQFATVSHVYDGDTLKLTNGNKVRLIGINTPEMNYETGKPDAFAKKAKSFLKQKVFKEKVGLRFGKKKKDRYGRLLAHVFLPSNVNVQQAILAEGLAVNIAIPPNLRLQDCYFKAEIQARQRQIGLWKNHRRNIINADNIKKKQTGFQFVKGKVIKVTQSKKAIWLKLSNKMFLQVRKKNLAYFKSFRLHQLRGKNIIARGWVNFYKKRYNMNIGHPAAIQVL